jgi:peptidoglycan/LPS O-acetylase OafA/YrhL
VPVGNYRFVLGFYLVMENADKDFRGDIQGIRGLAVFLVLAYHSGSILPGGFIGVDVFFVVSGFVITKVLTDELRLTGQVNLRGFYLRRVKRLLPSLALVTVMTLALSFLVLSPFGEQQDLLSSARATSLFGANYYFMLQDSYENLASNPLRHMWSLSVEEQFYLLFPFLVLIVGNISKRKGVNALNFLSLVTFVIGLLSFLLCYGLSVGRASRLIAEIFETTPEVVAFFSMPTRVWEFAAGILAYSIWKNKRAFPEKYATLISVVGICAIIWSAFSLKPEKAFPGLVATVPVIATLLLLVFGSSSLLFQKVFASQIAVFLGDISYSLYLWHWPLIVFAEVSWPSNEVAKPLAVIFSLFPAIVSYRYFENPLRKNSKLTDRKVLAIGVLCIVLPISFTSVGENLNSSIQNHFSDLKVGWVEKRSAVVDGCYGKIFNEWKDANCINYAESSNELILLVGDSQAASASDAVKAAARELGMDFANSSYPGCPMFERSPRDAEVCKRSVDFHLSLIDKLDPSVVVIANAGARYTLSGLEIERSEFAGGGFPSELIERESSVVESYSDMVRIILRKSKKVMIVLEPPQVEFSKQISLLRPNPKITSTLLRNQISRLNINAQIAKEFVGNSNVLVINIDDLICPTGLCSPKLDDRWIYMENSHLNPQGSLLLKGRIKDALLLQTNAS